VFSMNPGETVTGSLSANAPDAGSYTFDWSVYNPVTDAFDPVFSETGVSVSEITGLQEGGYKLRIFNGVDYDESWIAWLYIDEFNAYIRDKDAERKLLSRQYSCYDLRLNGIIEVDTFVYFDPVTHIPDTLENEYTFEWTSDNADLFIPFASTKLFPNSTSSPPYKDTWYMLNAEDSYGMKFVDSVFYESINIKSDFSFQLYDRIEDKVFEDPSDPAEGPAPLLVKFTNKSLNGSDFTWLFGTSKNADVDDFEVSTDFEYEPEYTYYAPDTYFPGLAASNEYGCVDTLWLPQTDPIIVLPSELEVPNVFSPDKNGSNEVFKVKHQSLKEFHIRIFSRTGNLVYKADVTDVNEWEGWDGTIRNSDRDAPPGAYYYVIEATGWDEVRFNGGVYKGVVYLFRMK